MTNNVHKLIGRQLEYVRRIKNNMSREKLSEVIGVSTTQIQKYENGHSAIKFATILQIAKHFNISVEELVPFDMRKFKD